MLDAIMESVKASTPASAEAPSAECEFLKESIEVGLAQAISEAGPSVSTEANPSETAPLVLEREGTSEKSKSPAPGESAEELEFIVRHASGKQLSEK